MDDQQNQTPDTGEAQGVDSQAEGTPTTNESVEGGQSTVSNEPDTGAAEGESTDAGENSGEETGEQPEAPAEPAAPTEPAAEPASENPVQPENQTQETVATGTDESPREGNLGTAEEAQELKSLEFKRTQMPISGDEVARIEYLKTLRYE